MKIFKNILSILFGLIFLNAGLNKFFFYMPMPELTEEQIRIFEAFSEITWLMPMIAVAEIAGGILFMIPKLRALGAIIILPVMTGILVHHLTLEPSGLPIAVTLFAMNTWILIDNRQKYKPLFVL